MAKRSAIVAEVDGRQLELSNLDKVLYPSGFTKGEVIDYYARVSSALLPHLRGRPATRKRYPDGVGGPAFFEKNAPSHTPGWVRTEMGGSDAALSIKDSIPFVVDMIDANRGRPGLRYVDRFNHPLPW